MATPNVGILTNAGKNLIDQVNAGQTKITFSKIAFSSMDNSQLTDDQVKALTAITPQEVVVDSPEVTLDNNTGETRIRATGTNEALTDGVYVKTYAVYAKDDSGNEILYGITVSPNPNYLPEYDGVTPQAVTYSYKVNISNTSNITFTNSNDIYVSDTDLAEALQPYAKTVDVNQQLDKKVNVADMRKPASDVAGIEEVNAKQDKIGYTPADDSKVVHDNHDGTITANGASILPANEDVIGRIDGTYTDMNDIPMGWLYLNGWAAGGIANWGLPKDFYYVHCFKTESSITANIQIAYDVRQDNTYVRTLVNTNWTTWKLLADDSKVAHLSGANNFDTVPTVNNNPLLLASSLPSDLARTGQDQEFTGKNTFDVAPIDKTTGNPYITKDGVPSIPSDVARTSQQTNFTAGLQSNGQDVLTVKTPGVPKLAVNYNVNSKAFDYTMTAPEKDGFSDIIQYNLLWKDHSVDDWTTVIVNPDALTGQLTGVDITKTYDFKAAAQNAVGSSDFTDVITLPAASAPGIPSLTVEYDAGKKGFDYTVAAPKSDGGSEITGYSLEYQKQGGTDWTKVALKPDSLTGTVTDGIEAGNDYLFRVNAENAVGSSEYFTVSGPLPTVDGNIYGVSWDGSSSGALQRTDAAVGLKAGINGAQNDFDTRGPWGLMDKTVTDSYGNAFVRVPKFYIRKTQDKSKPLSTWQVSLVKQGDDWYLPNCFYDFDNKEELDYVDVSRYEGSIISGKLQSKTGVTPTTSQTIVQLRSAAVANNTDGKKGYHLWDVHTLDALQVLFTIEFATLDSQSIMKGNTDNTGTSLINTGATDNVKGSSGFVTSGATPMTYRGIENLYGNLAMWTDGLNISNLSLYSCDDATKYVSDTFTDPYYKVGYPLISSTGQNITGLGFDKDHPSVEAPTSFNNDQYNTYYHDYGYVYSSGNYVVYTGGSWGWGAGLSGLWYWRGLDSSTDANSYVGSRLIKKAL